MKNKWLETDRLILSNWSKEDFPLAFKLWGNTKVTRFIAKDGIFSTEDIEKRLALEIANWKKHHLQYAPIFTKEDAIFIGCAGLRPYEENTLEIGFHLLPNVWGKGYGKEIALEVIAYAKTLENIDYLFAGHHPENTESEGLLLKLGFIPIEPIYYEPTGLFHPSYRLNLKRDS